MVLFIRTSYQEFRSFLYDSFTSDFTSVRINVIEHKILSTSVVLNNLKSLLELGRMKFRIVIVYDKVTFFSVRFIKKHDKFLRFDPRICTCCDNRVSAVVLRGKGTKFSLVVSRSCSLFTVSWATRSHSTKTLYFRKVSKNPGFQAFEPPTRRRHPRLFRHLRGTSMRCWSIPVDRSADTGDVTVSGLYLFISRSLVSWVLGGQSC